MKNLETYFISEVSHLNATREAVKVMVKSLRGAKAAASIRQAFQGTVLKIEDAAGNLVAFKDRFGFWSDGEIDF